VGVALAECKNGTALYDSTQHCEGMRET